MSDIKSYSKKYKKIKNIGSGGQGHTFLANDIKEEKPNPVIIKLLNDNKNDERRARMYREFVSMHTLTHPNIPRVIDSNTEFYLDKTYTLYRNGVHLWGNFK